MPSVTLKCFPRERYHRLAPVWAALWWVVVGALLSASTPAQAQGSLREARDLADPQLKQKSDLRVGIPVAVTTPPFRPGQEVIYRVDVSNAGSVDSPDTLIRISLPKGLLGGAWSCTPEPALGSLRLQQSFANNTGLASGLYGASGLAFDPDGHTLWVAAGLDACLVQFSRDRTSGEWRARSVIKAEDAVVSSMMGAAGLWISPEGRDLYLTGSLDNAITQFRLDRAPDKADSAIEPRLVHVLKQGIEGVDGLVGATQIIADPEGKFLYVAAPLSQAITVLARDPGQGRLSYLASFGNAEAGRQALAGVNSLAISQDGRFLYAASYLDNTVMVWARDPANGRLKITQILANERDREESLPLAEPYDLALSPDGRHLYVAALASDALLVFRRDAASGQLTHLETLRKDGTNLASLDGPCAVALSPDGLDVVVACQFSSTVMEFRRDPLTGKLQPLGEQREGQGSVSGLSGASGLAFSPDGGTLAAAAGESSALHLFQKVMYLPQLSGGGDVRTRSHLPVGGRLIYTIRGQAAPLGEAEMTIRARVDAGADLVDTAPENNFAERTDNVERPETELSLKVLNPPAEIPAGGEFELQLLVKNEGAADAPELRLEQPLPPGVLALGWSSRTDPARNVLTPITRLIPPPPVDASAPPPPAPRESIAIDPAQEQRRAEARAREAAKIDPALTWQGAYSLIASPDGRHVYALCANPARIVIFQRDLSSGAIGPVGVFPQEGEQLAHVLLQGITRLVFTPEGEGLFALNPGNGALALFRRDPLNGSLFLSTLWRANQPGLAGLRGAADLALSPDGRHLLIYQASPAQLMRVSLLPSRPGMVLWQNAPPILLNVPDATSTPSTPIQDATNRPPVMALGQGGRLLYIADPRLGGVAAFTLPDLATPAEGVGAAPLGEIQGPPNASALYLSPDGTGLYAFDGASGELHQLRCDNFTGAMLPAVTAPLPGGPGPNVPQGPLLFLDAGRSILLTRLTADPPGNLVLAQRNLATQELAVEEVAKDETPRFEPAIDLALSMDGRDIYALSGDDSAILHYRDDRPRVLPAAEGPLNTRLGLPAGSSATFTLRLRVSPAIVADSLLFAPSLRNDTSLQVAPDVELATASTEIRVSKPAQAKISVRAVNPPLTPGTPAGLEVTVRNESLTPLLESSMEAVPRGPLRDVRWKALALPAAGQWRDLVTRPLRDADSGASTVDLALSPDESRLFVLERDPARLRVFRIDANSLKLDEGPATEFPEDAFTSLETGADGRFVFLLAEGNTAIHTLSRTPAGKYELASTSALQAPPDAYRLRWDDSTRRLELAPADSAAAKPLFRLKCDEASGRLDIEPLPGPLENATQLPRIPTTHDNLLRFALGEDGHSLNIQRNSVSQYQISGEGDIYTNLQLDGQSEVTFLLEGDLAEDALGFVNLDAKLHKTETAIDLSQVSERWRVEPRADVRGSLTPLAPPRLGQAGSFELVLKNHGPSTAAAIWLRQGPHQAWEAASLPEHVSLPHRVRTSLRVGQEARFRLAYSASAIPRPAGAPPDAPLPLPSHQEAIVIVAPATRGLELGENRVSYVYPRPRMEWSYRGFERIARREQVRLDALLNLPADTTGPLTLRLEGSDDWVWWDARLAALNPGEALPESAWEVQLQPADPATPSVASVTLRRRDGVDWTGGDLRLVLEGGLPGLGTLPSGELEPPAELRAQLEFVDTLYGLASSPAFPEKLVLPVGLPNPSVTIAAPLPNVQPKPGEQAAVTGAIPVVIRNLQAEGVAPLVDYQILPEAPRGWHWIGAEASDSHLSVLESPKADRDDYRLHIRVNRLLPGQSTVLWLHARRGETGGE